MKPAQQAKILSDLVYMQEMADVLAAHHKREAVRFQIISQNLDIQIVKICKSTTEYKKTNRIQPKKTFPQRYGLF